MYKYLVVLYNETVDYVSNLSDNSLFNRKKLIVDPITLVVEAFDENEAESEALGVLKDQIDFKETSENKKSIDKLNFIRDKNNDYYVHSVVKLSDWYCLFLKECCLSEQLK